MIPFGIRNEEVTWTKVKVLVSASFIRSFMDFMWAGSLVNYKLNFRMKTTSPFLRSMHAMHHEIIGLEGSKCIRKQTRDVVFCVTTPCSKVVKAVPRKNKCLFYDADSISDHIKQNGRMKGEFERVWKEAVFDNKSGICPEGLRKTSSESSMSRPRFQYSTSRIQT